MADDFIDTSAKRQIRQLAGQAPENGGSSQTVVGQWFTEQRLSALSQLADVLEAPDKFLVLSHVWLKIHDAARAAYLRHLHSRQPRPDFARFEGRGEERAEDLLWANAKQEICRCRPPDKAAFTALSLASSKEPNFRARGEHW